MCKEYEVKLVLKTGDIIRVSYGDLALENIRTGPSLIIKAIYSAHTIPDGLYKVSDKGTLVPYKPLPDLKGGEICEVSFKNRKHIFVGYYVGTCDFGSEYSFSYTSNLSCGDRYFSINDIESITILKPISQQAQEGV